MLIETKIVITPEKYWFSHHLPHCWRYQGAPSNSHEVDLVPVPQNQSATSVTVLGVFIPQKNKLFIFGLLCWVNVCVCANIWGHH